MFSSLLNFQTFPLARTLQRPAGFGVIRGNGMTAIGTMGGLQGTQHAHHGHHAKGASGASSIDPTDDPLDPADDSADGGDASIAETEAASPAAAGASANPMSASTLQALIGMQADTALGQAAGTASQGPGALAYLQAQNLTATLLASA